MANKFLILGIHDQLVTTVAGNSARVRMYVGDKEYDEDFSLPNLPSAFPNTVEVYQHMLNEAITKRMQELEVVNV